MKNLCKQCSFIWFLIKNLHCNENLYIIYTDKMQDKDHMIGFVNTVSQSCGLYWHLSIDDIMKYGTPERAWWLLREASNVSLWSASFHSSWYNYFIPRHWVWSRPHLHLISLSVPRTLLFSGGISTHHKQELYTSRHMQSASFPHNFTSYVNKTQTSFSGQTPASLSF